MSHVTHLDTAALLLRDWQLRAGPVYDHSKLNTRRIHVVWVSPNDWAGAGGFRYGNVRFRFDWATLVAGAKYYWVEAVTSYKPTATRILVTTHDRDGDPTLIPYNPAAGDGPWVTDAAGKHFWNPEVCLEVMVERSIPLTSATRIDFVRHHENRCCIAPKVCPDSGVEADRASARFLAAATLASTKPFEPHPLVGDFGGEPTRTVRDAWDNLLRYLSSRRLVAAGTITAEAPAAGALARGVLAAFARGDDEWRVLGALFASKPDLVSAVRAAVARGLSISSESALPLD
ncbi:hypothetical protein [Anaeromyxobacter paludicola]|uniref:hypothetical protein n=1 Tax=Anaeromyxobacter paludicola TaxID=2918171 RepID=UPI0020C13C7F|nr:hypothetical protein [Anaeromyxobacter paludicola]